MAAIDMDGAQVAAVDYAPAGWPTDAYTIVRRVRLDAADISTDPRARRRRTIPADQLTLALHGALDTVWAVSFIVTNIPVDSDGAGAFDVWSMSRPGSGAAPTSKTGSFSWVR